MKNPVKLGFETELSKKHTCSLEQDGYVIESNPGPMLWGLIVKDQQTYRQYGQVNKEQKINQHDVAGQLHTELLGPGRCSQRHLGTPAPPATSLSGTRPGCCYGFHPVRPLLPPHL